MKIFLGWSGERSQGMAVAIRDWLPLVLHYAEPWVSETDIAAGERWADAIAKELDACNFGILCVTPENLSSPWILFEAGSLAKSLENSRVVPLLLDLDLSGIAGPLAQFQAKKIDRSGVEEAVLSINRSAADPVQDTRVKQLFDALWPDLESKLHTIPAPREAAKPARSQSQILEDLVASVRALEAKLRDASESAPRPLRHRRLERINPMMLKDLAMVSGSSGPGDPMELLIFASLVRDEAPWLYELALDAYKSARAGNARQAGVAIERFRLASRILAEGPFAEEFGVDSRVIQYMLWQIDELQRSQPREVARRPRRQPKADTQPE